MRPSRPPTTPRLAILTAAVLAAAVPSVGGAAAEPHDEPLFVMHVRLVFMAAQVTFQFNNATHVDVTPHGACSPGAVGRFTVDIVDQPLPAPHHPVVVGLCDGDGYRGVLEEPFVVPANTWIRGAFEGVSPLAFGDARLELHGTPVG